MSYIIIQIEPQQGDLQENLLENINNS
jgi:hypothetical protein